MVLDFVKLLFKRKIEEKQEKIVLNSNFLMKELDAIGYKRISYNLTANHLQTVLKPIAYTTRIVQEN